MRKRGSIRGQVTIFIIVAIFIVAGGILFFVFKDDLGIGKKNNEDVNSVNLIVNSCLEKTTREGINYVALHGGYFEIPTALKFPYFTDKYAYYYINSQKHIPTEETIASELKKYILFNFKSCINFSSIEQQGKQITEEEFTVIPQIIEEGVFVEMEYPITIKTEKDSYRLTDFDTEINENVLNLYLASKEISESYSLNSGFVCLNCLDEVSNKYNVNARATSIGDKNVFVFTISNLEDEELNWKFVVQNE